MASKATHGKELAMYERAFVVRPRLTSLRVQYALHEDGYCLKRRVSDEKKRTYTWRVCFFCPTRAEQIRCARNFVKMGWVLMRGTPIHLEKIGGNPDAGTDQDK